MTIEEMLEFIMSEMRWINTCLVILTMTLGVTVGYLAYKLRKQNELIDDVLYELDRRGCFSKK